MDEMLLVILVSEAILEAHPWVLLKPQIRFDRVGLKPILIHVLQTDEQYFCDRFFCETFCVKPWC